MLPNLGPMELAFILILGVLLFGKRLPEVGRSLGKGIVEFKKGLNGIGDELDGGSSANRFTSSLSAAYRAETPEPEKTYHSDVAVPKFEVPGVASDTPAPAAPEAVSTVAGAEAPVAATAQEVTVPQD